ncbi:MAG: cation-transporting P-type ATPase, partial [Pseudomonadota bacterium]
MPDRTETAMPTLQEQKPEHPFSPVSSLLPWHHFAAGKVLTILGVERDGLTKRDVSERRLHYGPNRLPAKRRPGIAILFLRQF